ncbi:MAG TPA: hypothetical protein V6C57_16805, partial [Coleofasciculaceae cyanobacterium]
LVKDWEMVTITDNGLNKDDILRSHISDAAGYLLHTLYPYKKIASDLRGKGGSKKPSGLAA